MSDEWYVARRGPDGNKRSGPVPLRQLRQLIDAGKVKGEDLVWRDGMANWQRADRCDDLFPSAPAPVRRGPRDDADDDDDRRGPRYDRGPRRYGPRDDDDDRPYRRPYRRPQSSNGWVVGLAVGGGVALLFFLACGGLVAYSLFRSPKPPFPMGTATTASTPPVVQNGAAAFNPPPGGAPVALGQRMPFGLSDLSELYYTNNVTLNDAQLIGIYLSGQGYFPPGRRVTVQVDRNLQSGEYTLRFCVKAGVVGDEDAEGYFNGLKEDIESDVLPNSVVHIDLCDEQMNTRKTLP
jgi:GYF domain 2